MIRTKNKLEVTVLALPDGRYVYNWTDDSSKIKEFISEFADKEITIIYDASTSRSKAQNAFFHAVLIQAIQKTLYLQGMPNSDNREFVKEVVIKKPYLTVNHDTPEEYVRPTSSLSVDEFWDFCNYCIDLLIKIGGRLDEKGQEKYFQIVEKYKLGKFIDEVLK